MTEESNKYVKIVSGIGAIVLVGQVVSPLMQKDSVSPPEPQIVKQEIVFDDNDIPENQMTIQYWQPTVSGFNSSVVGAYSKIQLINL